MKTLHWMQMLAALFISTAALANHHVSEPTVTYLDGFTRMEWTVSASDNPIDKFTVYRIYRTGLEDPRGVFLLLGSSRTFGFESYEIRDHGNYATSLVGRLAAAGIEVWGYSFRTHRLKKGTCASEDVDCSVMKDWGMSAVIQDVDYILARIKETRPTKKLVIGGFSMGAMLSYAVMNARAVDEAGNQRFAGAVIWDGLLYSDDPEVTTPSKARCDALRAQIDQGIYYDETTFSALKEAAEKQRHEDPTGPNRVVYVTFLTTPSWDPAPGFRLVQGSVVENRFYISSEQRVYDFMMQLNDIDALPLVRDAECGFSGERTHTGNLGAFRAPVLSVKAEYGFGHYMNDNLALLGSTDVEDYLIHYHAHLDTYTTPNHRWILSEPMIDWLLRKPFANAN